jgi:hypothetical protein
MTTHATATPFKKAGYTKDTKFRVLNNGAEEYGIYEGDIVWLHDDDGSTSPAFTAGDDYMFFTLPGQSEPDLEVYVEGAVKEGGVSKDQDVLFPTITLTHNLTIKGHTHVLTTEEMIDVFEGLRAVMLLPEEKNND